MLRGRFIAIQAYLKKQQQNHINNLNFTLKATRKRRNEAPQGIFLGSKITVDGDCSHEIKRCLLLGKKVMTNLDSILKSRHYFANKGPSSQDEGFSSGQVWMQELDCEES